MPAKKFGIVDGREPAPFSYGNSFEEQQTTGPMRLIVGPEAKHIDVMAALTRPLPEPFGVLYVLLEPAPGAYLAGRYQSPAPCSRKELKGFLGRFREYFESHGFHALWVISLPAQATLVYDQHNLIYAYGPLEQFKTVLKQRGLAEAHVEIPVPHVHFYYREAEAQTDQLMRVWSWRHFPLAQGDDD